jgi:hypothetical protein
MVKVEYALDNNEGVMMLDSIGGYNSKKDILNSVNTSELMFSVIDDVLSKLKPNMDLTPDIPACSRDGDKRNIVTPESEAHRLGFSKLTLTINDLPAIIICV